MTIYPAIDVFKGNAVRLKQGRADEVTVYGEPLQMAERWVRAGTSWLHMVDLDGAFEGRPRNHSAVETVVRSFPELHVQLGGGIRTMDTLEAVLNAGVRRAVLGTSVVTDPGFAGRALKLYGDRIAIGIDARDGIARVSGWVEDSRIGAIELAQRFEDLGASIVIYTDISRDGLLVGPNIEALTRLLDQTGLRVIASGGVSNIDDVRALAGLGHPRLDGVIIGKALYEGVVRLEEALQVC